MKLIVLFVSFIALIGAAQADVVKGRIAGKSNKAGTFQIDLKGKGQKGQMVVRTDAGTQYENTEGFKALGPPDLIEVTFEPGKPASKIKKVVFGLPPGVEIDVKEMLDIMTSGKEYHLFDARPGKRFGSAHIPGARSAFPKDDDFLSKLPADKDALLVFYCGGPTCPYTGIAVDKAKKAGYTNLKGFQDGLPGWKKAKLPVHVEAEWLAKHLDPQHVVLDVRKDAASADAHIKGAVAMPVDEIQAMTDKFIDQQKAAHLPGVTDMRAPVIVYAESHTSKPALLAYRELRNWGYKKATVLYGGLDNWQAKGLPTESGAGGDKIVYEKKLAPGAIAPKEFMAKEKAGEAFLVDVRTEKEVSTGKIEGARHIPLEKLEDRLAELPKDKEILVYCANGIRAEMGYQVLKDKGYQVRYLNETINVDKDGSYTI